jgi:hypothetical protein
MSLKRRDSLTEVDLMKDFDSLMNYKRKGPEVVPVLLPTAVENKKEKVLQKKSELMMRTEMEESKIKELETDIFTSSLSSSLSKKRDSISHQGTISHSSLSWQAYE